MWDQMVSSAIAAQHLANSLFNGGDQLGIGDLLSAQITDVEDIKHLVHLGGNLSDPDIQIASEQGFSDSVKKPREVVSIDFNDGEKIRATIVHDNFIRSRGCAFGGGLVGPQFFIQDCIEGKVPIKGRVQILFDPRPCFIFKKGVGWGLDFKNVKGDMIAPGVDLSIQNVQVVEG